MSCPEFIADSLALRTAAHLSHLSTRSYSQHVALGDFYTALTDLVDKYAEIYMGLEGHIASSKWPDVTPSMDEPVDLLEGYLATVKEEMQDAAEHQSLLNTLAEIEELTARTLYKLRSLK